jgi:transcription elongation factor GreA
MVERVPITRESYEALQQELSHLKSVVRPQVIQAIREAREHGDLRENAEYQAAKEKQSFTEGRILQLEDRLGRAQIIDTSNLDTERVVFGTTVKLLDMDSEEEKAFTLVGQDEADGQKGKISILSPVARALVGREIDDIVEIRVPKGTLRYQIRHITFE